MDLKQAPENRRALGRGLSALLNTGAAPTKSSLVESEIPKEETISGSKLSELEISKIEPNHTQPRKFFNEEKLQELAISLKEQGLIQPIVVSRSGPDKYIIVAGERRWRASKLAGLTSIPAIIRGDSRIGVDNDFASLAENIQREELNAIELAHAYERLIKTYLLTQEQLAEKLGVSRVSIANTLRLLKLPQSVQKLMIEGKLSEGHSRALLSLQTEDEISKMAESIVANKLTVRDVESKVRMTIVSQGLGPKNLKSQNPDIHKGHEVLAMEEELRQLFGTKVAVRGVGDRGTIEIYYSGSDSLNRILHLLRGLKG